MTDKAKICSRCLQILSAQDFYQTSEGGKNLKSACKLCHKKTVLEYRDKNREAVNRRKRENRLKNLERYRFLAKEWRFKNPEKSRIMADKAYKIRKNNGKNKKYLKTKYENDPVFKIKILLRSRFKSFFNAAKSNKHFSSIELLGCEAKLFKEYLESKFLPGMTWENHGKWKVGQPMKWHIDHIISCSAFDLTNPEEQKKCFHYSNMQPLWAIDNLKKNDKTEVFIDQKLSEWDAK